MGVRVLLEGMGYVGRRVRQEGSAPEPVSLTLLDHHCIFVRVHKPLCASSSSLSEHLLGFRSRLFHSSQ